MHAEAPGRSHASFQIDGLAPAYTGPCCAVPRDDPFSVSGDLHGLMGGAPPEIRPAGDIAAWYQKLCTSSSGVLYEDTYLQASLSLLSVSLL